MSGSGTDPGGRAADRPKPAAPAPASADVGIVAAMSIEVGFLLDRLKKVRKYAGPRHTVIEGESGGKLVAVIVGGMGRHRARGATELLIAGHRPRWVVSAGFAGALDPGLKRNRTVLPGEVVDTEGRRFTVDGTGPAGESRPRLLTVDAIVRTATEKAALRERFGADLVDMESSAVADLCRERALRFLSVRVVSDEAEVDLPREIATLMTRSGSYRVGAALRAIWNRPSAVKDFWSLHEHAQEAADHLAEATLAAVERLPV
jgi:adenosylhomocysteine nucleosidase